LIARSFAELNAKNNNYQVVDFVVNSCNSGVIMPTEEKVYTIELE